MKRVVPGLICHQETAKTLIFEDISLRSRYNLRRSLTFQTPSWGAGNKILVWRFSYWGGCKPAEARSRRRLITPGRFSKRASIVARPQGVCPTIWVVSSLQLKCSCQFCCRGLKIAAVSPVDGSMEYVLVCLRPLQPKQAQARFSRVVAPPR